MTDKDKQADALNDNDLDAAQGGSIISHVENPDQQEFQIGNYNDSKGKSVVAAMGNAGNRKIHGSDFNA